MKKTQRSFVSLFMLGAILMSILLFPLAVSATTNIMTVVSDTTTQVTAVNAVLAWVHPAWSSVDHTFSNDAKWIWDSYRVQHPVAGDIVEFKQEFNIPGSPTSGTMYITCDNGYELRINGQLIGIAQLGTGWRTSNLTESFVNSSGWQSVETWDITAVLVSGLNTIEISAANEYMGPLDGGSDGTIDSNPGGLIFETQISYSDEGGGGGGGGGGGEIPPVEVGGTVYPVNKMVILAPWIFLTAVLTTGVVIVFRRGQIQS